MDCILEMNNVNIYNGNELLLSVDKFNINPGDYICIQGENGTGKSTFLKAIGYQSDNNLTVTGEVLFQNCKIKNNIDYLKNKIVFIAQTPEFMDYNGSIKSELKMLMGNKVYNKKLSEIITFFDEFLGEGEYLKICNKKIIKFNEGHKKLIYILIKVFSNPDLILLLVDEPLNHLDHKFSPKINKMFNDIIKKKNTAIVFISHCKMFVNPNRAVKILKENKKVIESSYKSEKSCFGCVDDEGNYLD